MTRRQLVVQWVEQLPMMWIDPRCRFLVQIYADRYMKSCITWEQWRRIWEE